MRLKLSRYFEDIPGDHYLLATFFDPRIKKGLLPEHMDDMVFDALVETHLQQYAKPPAMSASSSASDTVSTTSKVSGARFLQSALSKRRGSIGRTVEDEITQYTKFDIVDVETDVVDWWNNHAGKFPTLSSAARDFNTLSATCVPCEQTFAKGTDLVTAKRNRLGADSIQASLCLQSWDRLSEQVSFPPLEKTMRRVMTTFLKRTKNVCITIDITTMTTLNRVRNLSAHFPNQTHRMKNNGIRNHHQIYHRARDLMMISHKQDMELDSCIIFPHYEIVITKYLLWIIYYSILLERQSLCTIHWNSC